MTLKIIFSLAASIIKILLVINFFFGIALADKTKFKYFSDDHGVISIMYHRFNENKYPSTNIKIEIFKEHIKLIKDKNIIFYNPGEFDNDYKNVKSKKRILITIDDAFLSFYNEAWPILKEEKIPFILFVSTEPVGKKGYMTWDQIREISKFDFAYIGNHSHSHEYLVDFTYNEFKKDINKSIKIFKEKLEYNPIFFSYPFGEFNLQQVEFIKKNFKYGFGQHSGVIDYTKNPYELPRFPINEKYGEIDRFKFLLDLFPIPYRSVKPTDKFINNNKNPPEVKIEFFKEQKTIVNLNCFSNDGENWGTPKMKFDENILTINFNEKFIFRRGRLNCSIKDNNVWRWLGLQFSVKID